MSIIKVAKKNGHFTTIATFALNDETLSWKAKGIHTYLMSKPENWEIFISHLEKQSTDGRDSTAAGIKELMQKGYIKRDRIVNNIGQFEKYAYEVYETSMFLKAVNGKAVNGKAVNGKAVNGKAVNGKAVTNKIDLEVVLSIDSIEKNKNVSSSDEAKEEETFFEKVKEPPTIKSDTCINERGTAAAARSLEDCRKILVEWALANKQEVEAIKAQAQWNGTKEEGKEATRAATESWYGYIKHSEAFKSDPVAFFKKHYKVWLLKRKTMMKEGDGLMATARTLHAVEHAIQTRYRDVYEDFTDKQYKTLTEPLTDSDFDIKLAAMAKKHLAQFA